MASPIERRRNNVKAGIFVTIALAIAVAIIVVLSGVWERISARTREYTVRYTVASGVNNLKKGGEVRVGGVLMGRVAAVNPQIDEGAPFEQIDVDFKINEQITLYSDAQVFVTSPLLGTDAWLDIIDVGDPAEGEPPNGLVLGSVSTGMLNSVFGVENASRTSEIVENTRNFSEFLASMPDEFEGRIVPIIDNVTETTGDAKMLVKSVRTEDWPRWRGSVDTVMTWATDFTVKLDDALLDGRGLIDDGRGLIAEHHEEINTIVSNVTDASGNVKDASVHVKDASVDVKEFTAHLNAETIKKADRLLDRGNEAIDAAVGAIQTITTDYEGWAVEIGESLGNATMASQQLKLALVEIRRSPWKVLYRPSEDEVAHELLYDAARSFALATADLKAASASVNAMLDKYGDRLADDPALVDRLKRNLVDPLENYERAQERLLDVLFEE